MIIDIIVGSLLQQDSNARSLSFNSQESLNISPDSISFHAVALEYSLDFMQTVAFEIMASSFILKSMQTEGVTEEKMFVVYYKQRANR